MSNTTPRQARSLSRCRLRPASVTEETEDSSEATGGRRGRVRYRQPRSQSVAVSNNQVLPCTLSKVKISETEPLLRKQVTFLPTWQVLPTSKVQLVSYDKELKKKPR